MSESQTFPKHQQPPVPAAGRIDALDVAKGIGMILVVFAHINYTPAILIPIYSVHMPLFFLLAGVVFRREKYPAFRGFLISRLKSLLLPYLFFCLAPIAASLILERITGMTLLVKNGFLDALWETLIARSSATVVNPPLWFVPCLLAVEILYYFISKLKKPAVAVVCAALASLGWLLESGLIPSIPLPWSLDSALFALSFYTTGNLCAPYLKTAVVRIREHRRKILICLGILLLCVLIWYPAARANGKISMGSKILNNGFLLYLTGVAGTVGILAVSILLEKSGFLKYLGRNTFCIMGVHYLLKIVMIKFIAIVPGIPQYSEVVLSETLVPFLIVFTLSVLSTFVYNAAIRLLRSIGGGIRRG